MVEVRKEQMKIIITMVLLCCISIAKAQQTTIHFNQLDSLQKLNLSQFLCLYIPIGVVIAKRWMRWYLKTKPLQSY